MTRTELKQKLAIEIEKWSGKPYSEYATITSEPIAAYECGKGKQWYQVEVLLLEHTAEHVRVVVCVDDGGWRSFLPMSRSFLVYSDGRVDV